MSRPPWPKGNAWAAKADGAERAPTGPAIGHFTDPEGQPGRCATRRRRDCMGASARHRSGHMDDRWLCPRRRGHAVYEQRPGRRARARVPEIQPRRATSAGKAVPRRTTILEPLRRRLHGKQNPSRTADLRREARRRQGVQGRLRRLGRCRSRHGRRAGPRKTGHEWTRSGSQDR